MVPIVKPFLSAAVLDRARDPSENGAMKQPPPQAFGPGVNRIVDVISHTSRYGFKGVGRLARDAGVSPSTLSKIMNGKINPSFMMVARIAGAIERELGRKIDLRDIFAEHGEFPTRYTCDLAACRGCLPECATDEYGNTKRAFEGVRPGKWVTSRYPRGLSPEEGGHCD